MNNKSENKQICKQRVSILGERALVALDQIYISGHDVEAICVRVHCSKWIFYSVFHASWDSFILSVRSSEYILVTARLTFPLFVANPHKNNK